ncbi:MAG: hypothetical protein AAB368_08015 [bacterium]
MTKRRIVNGVSMAEATDIEAATQRGVVKSTMVMRDLRLELGG